MTVEVFKDRDGTAFFTCLTCGGMVCSYRHVGTEPKCLTCRYFEEMLPDPVERERALRIVEGRDG